MNSGGLKAGVCTKNISGGEQQTNKKVVVVSYLFFSVIVFMLVLVWKDNKKKTWRRYIYIEIKKRTQEQNYVYKQTIHLPTTVENSVRDPEYGLSSPS